MRFHILKESHIPSSTNLILQNKYFFSYSFLFYFGFTLLFLLLVLQYHVCLGPFDNTVTDFSFVLLQVLLRYTFKFHITVYMHKVLNFLLVRQTNKVFCNIRKYCIIYIYIFNIYLCFKKNIYIYTYIYICIYMYMYMYIFVCICL